MAKTYIVLEEADGAILLRLIEKEKKTPRNEIKVEQERPNGSPETYVIRVPDGGIPPLTRASSGTSSLDSDYDVPGVALCQVYKTFNNLDLDVKELRPVSGFLITVLNISQTWVDSVYAIATREKYGCYVVECPCVDATGTSTTGTGSGSTGTGTGTGTTGTGTGTSTATSTATSTSTADTGTGSTGTSTDVGTSTSTAHCQNGGCIYQAGSGGAGSSSTFLGGDCPTEREDSGLICVDPQPAPPGTAPFEVFVLCCSCFCVSDMVHCEDLDGDTSCN